MAISGKDKGKMAFGLIAGAIYMIFGVLQIVVRLGLTADILDGFVLLVVGAVFLHGFKDLKAGISEGVAYIYFGILLSLIFTVIYLLLMGADAICAYALRMEDFKGWTPLDDMKPGLYLGFLPLVGYIIWRDKFTLRGLSRAGT